MAAAESFRTDSNFIWLGDGVTMVRSTDADFALVHGRLRPGDRAEERVFGEGRRDRLEDMESAWTVRDGAEVVCWVALALFRGDGPLSRRRLVAEMTTDHVWRARLRYVRHSRRVLAAVVENGPSWAEEFLSTPMEAYAQSVRWQERVLGFRRAGRVVVNGVAHAVLRTTRQEVLGCRRG